MKKYTGLALALVALCCVVHADFASAGTGTYIDNGGGSMTDNYMFPGQTSSNTNCLGQDTCPNASSPPNITTVVVEWAWDASKNTNVLTKITLTTTNDFLFWDSLFINSDYTGVASNLQEWDYFVHNGGENDHYVQSGQDAPGNGLYQVAGNFTTNMYTTASEAADGRTGHANGIDASYLNALEGTSFVSRNGYQVVYDFSSLTTKIALGDNFAIGYTPYCANDVVLVAGSTGGAPGVPEPATMVLFGAGMAGLAGWRARRNKQKK
ncbi:MAG: PEP-CTERM sorting domain-containing protein [Desulfobulbaceae bacterium]|nr:PEP-CTERM sorting domain-containing protein [Desulfobulbaceae bacterium]